MMKGKHILLCVTGGVAAYKAAALTSQLTQRGAEVKVIMTEGACQFITPLTFQALSRQEVYIDTFAENNPAVIAHIDLADWADLVLVAPATANTIAKLAAGIADNMVTTTILATKAPVWIAPAMNVHMYEHPAVRANIEQLYRFGYRFIEPSEGYLACGYIGKGRLEEPEKIIAHIERFFADDPPLFCGKHVLVTAGPTREKLDPVRYFSNYSSGKMGYAIAEAAARFGASVTLVSGPTALAAPDGVEIVPVESAAEMYEAVMARFAETDIVIKAAAVADYRPKYVAAAKIKKQPGDYVVEMERTIDILKTLGEQKTRQILVGFAAETDNLEQYALKKLEEKRLDLVIANNVTEEGAGFAGDTNIVTIFRRDGATRPLPLMTKREAAEEILKEIHAYTEGIR